MPTSSSERQTDRQRRLVPLILSPLKWSALKYVFGIKEDRYVEEASQA